MDTLTRNRVVWNYVRAGGGGVKIWQFLALSNLWIVPKYFIARSKPAVELIDEPFAQVCHEEMSYYA